MRILTSGILLAAVIGVGSPQCELAPATLASSAEALSSPERTAALISHAAYDDGPQLPRLAGFRPAVLPGVPLKAGRFANGSAAALVLVGPLGGADALVVAVAGSEDPQAWLTDLRDIDQVYAGLAPLIRAVEAYVAAGGRAVLVGHSLGGSMVQLFMYGHAGDSRYRAMTFGSPGALPKPGLFAARPDPRIVNFVIRDDPFVYLGEHRAQAADFARRHPAYGLLLALEIAQTAELPVRQVLASAAAMSADYVNNGLRVELPGRAAPLSMGRVAFADPDEHQMETYRARLPIG